MFPIIIRSMLYLAPLLKHAKFEWIINIFIVLINFLAFLWNKWHFVFAILQWQPMFRYIELLWSGYHMANHCWCIALKWRHRFSCTYLPRSAFLLRRTCSQKQIPKFYIVFESIRSKTIQKWLRTTVTFKQLSESHSVWWKKIKFQL